MIHMGKQNHGNGDPYQYVRQHRRQNKQKIKSVNQRVNRKTLPGSKYQQRVGETVD